MANMTNSHEQAVEYNYTFQEVASRGAAQTVSKPDALNSGDGNRRRLPMHTI